MYTGRSYNLDAVTRYAEYYFPDSFASLPRLNEFLFTSNPVHIRFPKILVGCIMRHHFDTLESVCASRSGNVITYTREKGRFMPIDLVDRTRFVPPFDAIADEFQSRARTPDEAQVFRDVLRAFILYIFLMNREDFSVRDFREDGDFLRAFEKACLAIWKKRMMMRNLPSENDRSLIRWLLNGEEEGEGGTEVVEHGTGE
jgi:hypothetical protein